MRLGYGLVLHSYAGRAYDKYKSEISHSEITAACIWLMTDCPWTSTSIFLNEKY